MRDKLTKSVDRALEPVIARHDAAWGETWNLNQQIAWREKEGREGARA